MQTHPQCKQAGNLVQQSVDLSCLTREEVFDRAGILQNNVGILISSFDAQTILCRRNSACRGPKVGCCRGGIINAIRLSVSRSPATAL